MAPCGRYLGHVTRRLRRPTLAEALVLLAIGAVLVALLLPTPKWAASGSMQLPVRVVVFDALHGTPIAGAKVTAFRGSAFDESRLLDENRDQYDRWKSGGWEGMPSVFTDADGAALIECEFPTSSNYERPTPHAHPQGTWVEVRAEGYGGVVIPVRHSSYPTQTLREQKELLVPVGLRAAGE